MSCCSSSPMDSSSDPRQTGGDLSTDLRLGLSIKPNSSSSSSNATCEDYKRAGVTIESWPPIKGALRSTLEENGRRATLYVKVYLEGVPIGRKLDLLAHDGYHALAAALSRMFGTAILLGRPDQSDGANNVNNHVLTYEDKEGDWMMVGDVPWRMFLSSVKRIKITRADRCF